MDEDEEEVVRRPKPEVCAWAAPPPAASSVTLLAVANGSDGVLNSGAGNPMDGTEPGVIMAAAGGPGVYGRGAYIRGAVLLLTPELFERVSKPVPPLPSRCA